MSHLSVVPIIFKTRKLGAESDAIADLPRRLLEELKACQVDPADAFGLGEVGPAEAAGFAHGEDGVFELVTRGLARYRALPGCACRR